RAGVDARYFWGGCPTFDPSERYTVFFTGSATNAALRDFSRGAGERNCGPPTRQQDAGATAACAQCAANHYRATPHTSVLQKRPHSLDSKGLDFFGRGKEAAS